MVSALHVLGSWEEVTLKEVHNLFLTELGSTNTTYMQKPESYVPFGILKFRLLTLLALISAWNVFWVGHWHVRCTGTWIIQ